MPKNIEWEDMQILTFYERQKIEFYLRGHWSIRAIGRELHRSPGVISAEIKRNQWLGEKYYSCRLAQARADIRAKKTNKRKLDKNEDLRRYVSDKLQADWSPEEIAGHLEEFPPPHLGGIRISHESIYRYIYETIVGRHLYQYLRKKTKPRRKHHYSRKKQDKIKIKERVSIHQRPTDINQRKYYGDWESDTVVFSKTKLALSVQCERKSGLVRLHRLLNRSKEETEIALTNSMESVPQDLRHSITFDNGGEGACHQRIRDAFSLDTYFCDPYASWQKGSVENANGLIREYLPRKINFAMITDEQIYMIQETLNNRPRKRLNYQTPNEVITNYLNEGVLLNS
jgi:transposase, IS30 family